MKRKGKTAYLITWEGVEAEHNGRCKVVAILPPQHGETSFKFLLPILFRSEQGYTLCEKLCDGTDACRTRDPMFRVAYRDINPEFHYGTHKDYLCARKVKNLRCEESKADWTECTLFWTELPKFIPNPEVDWEAPLPADLSVLTKQVAGEKDVQYSHSTRASMEEAQKRRTPPENSSPRR